jgi:hypothetical protein
MKKALLWVLLLLLRLVLLLLLLLLLLTVHHRQLVCQLCICKRAALKAQHLGLQLLLLLHVLVLQVLLWVFALQQCSLHAMHCLLQVNSSVFNCKLFLQLLLWLHWSPAAASLRHLLLHSPCCSCTWRRLGLLQLL